MMEEKTESLDTCCGKGRGFADVNHDRVDIAASAHECYVTITTVEDAKRLRAILDEWIKAHE